MSEPSGQDITTCLLSHPIWGTARERCAHGFTCKTSHFSDVCVLNPFSILLFRADLAAYNSRCTSPVVQVK